MSQTSPRYLFAIVQVIVGLNWLLTGLNKLFFGSFPQSLGNALRTGAGVAPALGHNPNGWYDAFIQAFILPNSLIYGYLIEWGEVCTGVAYLIGAILLLSWSQQKGRSSLWSARLQLIMTTVLTIITTFMCLNFNFWRGRTLPLFDPKFAYGPIWEANLILPIVSLCLLIVSVGVWQEAMRTLASVPLQKNAKNT
ncbi:MAG: hypothetical protein E6J34_15135 [Chloroflexi bacterium]|nr:MAG: hypothetical protein E6J34_15135 [Chloroflexota bacterium]